MSTMSGYEVRIGAVPLPSKSVNDDVLVGAAAIALFLFGDKRLTRKVYYLAEERKIPVFRLGGLCARRSTLTTWLQRHEAEGANGNAPVVEKRQ